MNLHDWSLDPFRQKIKFVVETIVVLQVDENSFLNSLMEGLEDI